MKKREKRFRAVLAAILACFLSAVLFASAVAVMPAAPVQAVTAPDGEKETNGNLVYGIEIVDDVPVHFYGDTEDMTEASEITVTCLDEWKDKIRYQWMYEDYDTATEREVYVSIEGETASSFKPSLDLLEKRGMRWFICRVTVEGDSEFFVDSDIVYYRKLNDSIDLTKTEYDDSIKADTSYATFIRKVQASADAKALYISGELAENVWEMTILDAKGRYFTYNRDEDLTEFDLETEGNFFYVYVIYMAEPPERIGISTIEERSEFVRKPFQLYAYADNMDGYTSFQPGEVFDISKMNVMLFYNDGTFETRGASDLSWDAGQIMHYGENRVTITDKETGLSITATIRINYMPQWKEKPAETFYAGEVQKASVQMPEIEGEEPLCCLWLIRNSQGDWAAEIEDDTETEIIIPQDLTSGRYQLFCFYYTKSEGFQDYKFLSTEFRVRASGDATAPTETPSVTEKPTPSAAPSASPAPGSKNPGKVTVSLKKHKKAVTIKIKRSAASSGCQIMYADNKAFTKKKHTLSTKKTSYKVKGLKKNQKIYIRVRAYCKAGKKKQYGKWSRVLNYKAS